MKCQLSLSSVRGHQLHRFSCVTGTAMLLFLGLLSIAQAGESDALPEAQGVANHSSPKPPTGSKKGIFQFGIRKHLKKSVSASAARNGAESAQPANGIVADSKTGDKYLAVDGEYLPLLEEESPVSAPLDRGIRLVSAQTPTDFVAPPVPPDPTRRPPARNPTDPAQGPVIDISPPREKAATDPDSISPMFGTLAEMRGGRTATIRPLTSQQNYEEKLPTESYFEDKPILNRGPGYLNSGSPETWIAGPFAPSFPFATNPLYFEDPNLERCGLYACDCCSQPVASAAHFFGNVAALPFKLLAIHPSCCVWPLAECGPCCRYGCCDNFLGQLQSSEDAAECGNAPVIGFRGRNCQPRPVTGN